MRRMILLLMLFVFACQPATMELTDADRQIVRRSVEENTSAFIAAAETADAAGLYATLRDVHSLGFVNDGYIYPPQDSLLAAFEEVFRRIESQEIAITHRRVWVISPTAAVSTNLGHGTTTNSEGLTAEYEFIWTFVYQKLDDGWKIVHSHLSFGS